MRQHREKTLTTNSVRLYKVTLIIFYALVAGVYVFNGFYTAGVVGVLLYAVLIGFIIYNTVSKTFKSLREISYDLENLYVQEKGFEIQIPYHEVKDVEITSLGGLYKFNLYREQQFGKALLCKPSIWYPLNYKKIDKELNRIRGLIRKAHQTYRDQIENDKSLASFN